MDKRIKLEIGHQRKLIEKAKRESELTWNGLAQRLKVSKAYLKNDLRYENVLLTESLYKRLCRVSFDNYDKYIVSLLNPNWGRVKGGQISGRLSKPRPVSLLVDYPSSELAEAIGIMLGGGNSWMKDSYYYVRISGNSEDEREYLVRHVSNLFSRVFKVKFDMSFHKTAKELTLTKGSKNLVYTLAYWGFPPGNKKRNNVEIPSWIFKSEEYLKACIRGLIDTDGSVCPITGRNYPYIWFSSAITNLRTTFGLAMEILGFRIAKWTGNRTPQTHLAKKSLVERYAEEIGFNNPKHKRYWAPVV